MALSNILAVGTTAASSTDITVVAGTPQTLTLVDGTGTGVPVNAAVAVQIKNSDDTYTTIDGLSYTNLATVLAGPGLFRVSRSAGSGACGVDLST